MSYEILSKIGKISHSYSREKPFDLKVNQSIGYKDGKHLQELTQLIGNPDFVEQINQGNVTLSAIKPQAQNSKLGPETDIEAEKLLKAAIGLDPILTPIFSISVILSPEIAESFYPQSVKENLSRPEHIANGNSWEDFMRFLTSGPITYIILWDSTMSGRAITRWRETIGTTDPEQAGPGTIRGNYATSKQNNLVHGSGNIPEAHREINWLLDLIKKITIKY